MGKRAKLTHLQYFSKVQDLLSSHNLKMFQAAETAIEEEMEVMSAKLKCGSIFTVFSSIEKQCRDVEAEVTTSKTGETDCKQEQRLSDVAAKVEELKENIRVYNEDVDALEDIERKSQLQTETLLEGGFVKVGLKKERSEVLGFEAEKRKEKEEEVTAKLDRNARLEKLETKIGTGHIDTIEAERALLQQQTLRITTKLQTISQESIYIQQKREQQETLALTCEDLRSSSSTEASLFEQASQCCRLLSSQDLRTQELQATIKLDIELITSDIEKLNLSIETALSICSEAHSDLQTKKTTTRHRSRLWENSLMQFEDLKTKIWLLRRTFELTKQQVAEYQKEFAWKEKEMRLKQERQNRHVQNWFQGEWKEKAAKKEWEQECEKIEEESNKRKSVQEREMWSSNQASKEK